MFVCSLDKHIRPYFNCIMDVRRVIVDVDVGIDDYTALLILLYGEKVGKIKIEAIVCTQGNTSLKNVCTNVVRLLELIDRTDIPVYKGCHESLIPLKDFVSTFNGLDGFADLEYDHEPDVSIIQDQHGVNALNEIITNNPNAITLICLAPLSTIALTAKLYKDFSPNVKEVWIMGGNYKGVGNQTSAAEFNIFVDPEAAHIVLHTFTCPIYILPWETCIETSISMDWRMHVLGNTDNPAVNLLNRAELKLIGNHELWQPADAFATAAFLDIDNIISLKDIYHITIELHGSETRAQVVVDHMKTEKPNVIIIERINEDIFKALLLEVAQTKTYGN